MRTNIDINDRLLKEAMDLTHAKFENILSDNQIPISDLSIDEILADTKKLR